MNGLAARQKQTFSFIQGSSVEQTNQTAEK
jgi:hypothetical protein